MVLAFMKPFINVQCFIEAFMEIILRLYCYLRNPVAMLKVFGFCGSFNTAYVVVRKLTVEAVEKIEQECACADYESKKTMPYKVVQTIERGETCLTVVPSGWEKNGILHWPKKNAVAKLSLDEFSVPSPKWERINYVKKREFKTRTEAEQEAERMESVSDTEADEVVHQLPSNGNENTNKDFNEVFLIPGQEVDPESTEFLKIADCQS